MLPVLLNIVQMKGYVFMILVLSTIANRSNAQYFNYVGTDSDFGERHSGVNYVGNTILSHAGSVNYDDSIPYVGYSIIEFDYNGNILHDTLIGNVDTTFVINYNFNNSDKIMAVVGDMRFPNQPTKKYEQFAYFINNQLNKSRTYVYQKQSPNEVPFIQRAIQISENEYACLIHVQDSSGSASSKARIIILDSLNNIMFNKSFKASSFWNIPNAIHKYDNYYYIIINTVFINNTSNPQNLVIYKLDTLGNIVNTYQTTNGKWYGAVSSAVLPNGDFIVGGFYAKGFYSSNPLDGVWQQKYLASFDKNLNLIWRKTFGTNDGISEITKVMIASDSTIVGCGVDTKIELVGADTMGHGTGCIFKFSLDGDSIWMHKYQGIDGEYGEINWMTNVDELPNNQGYVGCGYIDNYFPAYRRGWVFRTDANGCLDASCTDYMKEIDDVNSGFELILSPNPANTQVNITYFLGEATQAIVTLSSTTGNQVYEEKITGNTGTLHLHTSSFSSGIYLLKLQNSNGAICMKKLMLMHE